MKSFAFLLAFTCLAADIDLPAPARKGGAPLLSALANRHSTREYKTDALSPQVLSDLLWAAYGVNRPSTGGRTAPSAHNWQLLDVYVTLQSGLYRYDPASHRLVQLSTVDARKIAGTQDFTAVAPVNLVFVAQMSKAKAAAGDTTLDLAEWAAVEAGSVSQNAALFCASAGLANVVRAGVDRPAFAKLALLPADARIVLAQTIGYPAKPGL